MLVPTKDAQATNLPITNGFKVFDTDERESTLEDTAYRTLAQIEEKAYATVAVPAPNVALPSLVTLRAIVPP